MMAKDGAIEKRLKTMNHAFIVMSGKGGVGKSTLSCNS